MKRRLAFLASAGPVAVVLSLVLAACGDNNPVSTTGGQTAPAGKIVVGSANFPESVLLAEIYAGALSAKGVQVEKKLSIGSRETYIPALQDGSIDLLPEYTGNLLLYFDKNAKASSPDEVYAALQSKLPAGLILLEKSSAEDKDAVVVTAETAQKYNLKTIADLKPVAGQFVLGGPPEWRDRQTGVPGLKRVYGLTFKAFKPLDVAGELTVKALKDGTVQAANLFTTQSAIPANNFVALEDPQHLFLAQNVTPLINEKKAADTVKQALNEVSAKLTTDNLKDLVKRVEVDKADAATVAKDFLAQNGLS
jgi:osmoprotectant transport system substrate-binding protein